MSKFTPGPWNIVVDTNEHELFQEKVFAIYHENKEGLEFICDTGAIDSETAKSNAFLIASAPEMYDALEKAQGTINVLVDYIQGLYHQTKSMNTALRHDDAIRNALASNRGEDDNIDIDVLIENVLKKARGEQ